MEGRGGKGCVERVGRERHVLEATHVEGDRAFRHRAARHRDHLRPGVDGIHPQAAGHERPRQLARATTDLDHARSGGERPDRARVVDELLGVRGADALVVLRHAVEDQAGPLVHEANASRGAEGRHRASFPTWHGGT